VCVGRAYGMCKEERSTCRFLVGKSETKGSLTRTRLRKEDNNKRALKRWGARRRTGFI